MKLRSERSLRHFFRTLGNLARGKYRLLVRVFVVAIRPLLRRAANRLLVVIVMNRRLAKLHLGLGLSVYGHRFFAALQVLYHGFFRYTLGLLGNL